jgi:4-amino-4-deoxy-L-arabinose transferase-like glycosyltransferase
MSCIAHAGVICTRSRKQVHTLLVLRWLVVSLLALLVYLPGAGARFSNTAECQEALVVWEMVDSGNWVLPRINGEQIPSKPPLYHWIAIGFAKLTGGVSELSARLPSMAAAAATVGLVFVAGSAEWGAVAGTVGAVALATSPEWVKWATTARTDATFAFFLTCAFLLGERWLRSGRSSVLVGLAAATGAATLAKGFAGAALVGVVLVVEIWRRGAWRLLRSRDLAAASVIFSAIACSWYAAALAHAGGAFFQKQIILENVLRFFPYEKGGPSRQHSRLFYLPMLFTGMLPWSLALPAAFWRGVGERAPTARSSGFSGYLVGWLTIVFLVCTAASGKRTNYLLPLYPAAALLIGRELSVLLDRSPSRAPSRGLSIAGALAALIALLVASLLVAWRLGLAPWQPLIPFLHPQDRVLLPRMIDRLGPPNAIVVALAIVIALALSAATLQRAWRELYVLIGSTAVLLTVAGCSIANVLEAELKSFAPFTERVASTVGAAPLAFFRAPDLAVLFYLRRHVAVERGAFATIHRPGWALVWQKDWDALAATDRDPAEILDTSPPASVGRPDTRLLLVRLR